MEAYFISTFGETLGPIARIAAVALVVAFTLWILLLILRKFRSGLFVSGGSKASLPRLAVTDAVPVDSSRRLILVRRDDVEHLILIGGPNDVVVESGIGKPLPVVVQPLPRQPMQTTTPQSAPQPAPSITPQRAPTVAAREAVADTERGRLVRSSEPQIPERRIEPVVAAPVIQPSVQPFVPPVVVSPAITPPVITSAPIAQTPSTTPNQPPRGELDLDKLLDELRPNPLQDRQ